MKWHGLIEYFQRFTLLKFILCGLCYAAIVIVAVLYFLPCMVLGFMLGSGIYWWIIYELYVFNIVDTFIFVTSQKSVSNEMQKEPKNQLNEAWQAICSYMSNISDSINYQQRLCILRRITSTNRHGHSADDITHNIQSIIQNEEVKITKGTFWNFYVIVFLNYLMMHSAAIFGKF